MDADDRCLHWRCFVHTFPILWFWQLLWLGVSACQRRAKNTKKFHYPSSPACCSREEEITIPCCREARKDGRSMSQNGEEKKTVTPQICLWASKTACTLILRARADLFSAAIQDNRTTLRNLASSSFLQNYQQIRLLFHNGFQQLESTLWVQSAAGCIQGRLCSLCFSLHTSLSELSRGRILLYSNLPRAIEIVLGKEGWEEWEEQRMTVRVWACSAQSLSDSCIQGWR